MKRISKIIIGILVIIIFAAIPIGGSFFALEYIAGPLKEESIILEIPYGSGTEEIAALLKEEGVIRSTTLFQVSAKLMGKDEKWQAGTYTIKRGTGYRILFLDLTTPQKASVKVVIPEGLQVKTVARLFQHAGICDRDDFITAANKDLYDYEFLTAVTTRTDLEGYLFPDTYYFEPHTDAKVVINAMLARFEEKLYTENHRNRAEELGYTFDEMLTLASVVESEARLANDRKIIAGVFFNRLNNGDKMQSCVTVEYAMGVKKNIISTEDTKFDSPYNTYLYSGLPIGPICNPSEISLNAVLWPQETNYYYFQSDAKGTIHFTESYEEHVAVQGKVQENWERTDDYQQNSD